AAASLGMIGGSIAWLVIVAARVVAQIVVARPGVAAGRCRVGVAHIGPCRREVGTHAGRGEAAVEGALVIRVEAAPRHILITRAAMGIGIAAPEIVPARVAFAAEIAALRLPAPALFLVRVAVS